MSTITLDTPVLALLPLTPALATSSSLTSSIITSPSSSPLSLLPSSSPSSPPSTSHVIAFTSDHTFRLLDLHLSRPSRYIGGIPYARAVYALDPAGRVAVTSEHSTAIWRLDTWTCERTLDREEEVRAEASLRRGEGEARDAPAWEEKRAASPAAVSAVWPPIPSSSPYYPPAPSTRHPTFVCPLWSSSFIACGSSEGFIHLWRIGPSHMGQRRLASLRAHGGSVVQVEYVRGRRLVSCGGDRMVRLWQLDTGRGCGSGWEEEEEGDEEWTARCGVCGCCLSTRCSRRTAGVAVPSSSQATD